MKILISLLVLSFVASAETFIFLEQQTILQRGSDKTTNLQIDLWAQKDFHEKSKFGLFSWSQASATYQLAEGGLSYRPTSWLQVGGGAGAENIGSHERFVAFGTASKGKNFIFGTIENGGSGRWHQALYNRSIGRFGLGAMSQEFLGAGPRVEVGIKHFTFWSTAFFEKEEGRSNHNFIFGVRYVYSKP